MNKTLLFTLIFFAFLNDQAWTQEETVFNRLGGIRFSGAWGGTTSGLFDFRDNSNFSYGGYFVFEFNENLQIGWAGYKSDIDENGREMDLTGNDLLLGYSMNSDKIVHPQFYLQLGSGKLQVKDIGEDRIHVLQPTIGAEINIARFFRLGIDGGYRFVNDTELPSYTDGDFSGPILNIRLKFGWSW